MAKRTPLGSIRRYCVDTCCAGDTVYVRLCPSKDCALHPFRMGKNPNISAETRAKRADHMKGRKEEDLKKSEKKTHSN